MSFWQRELKKPSIKRAILTARNHRVCLLTTYKELKPEPVHAYYLRFFCLLTTYKELKLFYYML
jgi:hypothetical protein